MGRRVFISYSTIDSVLANGLSRYLVGAGWDVWMDVASIAGAEEWSAALTRGLRSTDAVIALITVDSMQSKWVQREILAADRADIPILPVRVGNPPIPDRLALVLNELQRIDVNEFDQSSLRQIEGDLINVLRRRTPDGRLRRRASAQMMVGKVLSTLGIIGLIVAFGMFFYFGYQWILTSQESIGTTGPGSFESRSDESLQGWLRAVAAFPVFFVSAILAAIGSGMRRSAERKQV